MKSHPCWLTGTRGPLHAPKYMLTSLCPCLWATAHEYVRKFARTLETAMQAGLEAGMQQRQHVYTAQLVRACPFYGYHPDERLFIKIMMCAPHTLISDMHPAWLAHFTLSNLCMQQVQPL